SATGTPAAVQLAEPFLLNALAYLESAPGFLCYVLLKLVGWPYGRYTLVRSAFRLPEQAAWAVQELPSRALPLLAGPAPPAERLSHWPNCILLAMFLVHYVFCRVVDRHADKHPFRSWPKEFQETRGDQT
uniref:Steroid 5-alpha reductase C-terminal domain-containing protein n=1 Tax=Monodon monoceros TaxID=40151 RepID=A0A8C6AHA8_MONMO